MDSKQDYDFCQGVGKYIFDDYLHKLSLSNLVGTDLMSICKLDTCGKMQECLRDIVTVL